MLAYGKENSRIRSDLHATPMPLPVSDLVHHCCMAVRHKLSPLCQSSDPNHVQLIGYYALFNSAMTRHKDDHELDDYHSMLFNNISLHDAIMKSKSNGAMVPGSDVVILTFGSMQMLMSFCFPHKRDRFAPRKFHKVHPAYQRFLTDRTLMVFKAVDDLHFYHEVSISPFQPHNAAPTDPSLYRFALCMRWLDPAKCAQQFAV